MQTQFGRRAYGAHRKMSEATVIRNVAASVKAHRAEGQERSREDYGLTAEQWAKVEALVA